MYEATYDATPLYDANMIFLWLAAFASLRPSLSSCMHLVIIYVCTRTYFCITTPPHAGFTLPVCMHACTYHHVYELHKHLLSARNTSARRFYSSYMHVCFDDACTYVCLHDACIHACMHVGMYVWTYVCMYVCMHHIATHKMNYTCTLDVCVCMCVCMYLCM